MHQSIYREFSLIITPQSSNPFSGAVIAVSLRHIATQTEMMFQVPPTLNIARAIEENVMQHFPASHAAGELRLFYGMNRLPFRAGWQQELGDRIYQGLTQAPKTKGVLFWVEQIPALPSVLYRMLNSYAARQLAQLGAEPEVCVICQTIQEAWRAVLNDADTLTPHISGPTMHALAARGWPMAILREMTLLDYGHFKSQAKTTLLALDYLTADDWHHIIQPLLASPMAAAA